MTQVASVQERNKSAKAYTGPKRDGFGPVLKGSRSTTTSVDFCYNFCISTAIYVSFNKPLPERSFLPFFSRGPVKRRKFTGVVQDFHRNQFIFTGKTQEHEKISVFQTEPKKATRRRASSRRQHDWVPVPLAIHWVGEP
jgi:hypothetical protein